jgi:hypothetical protein
MRLIWEDCAHDQRTHSPLLPHRPRQSRGCRTRTGELARARSRTVEPPCSKPGERDRDTSELFLLPYTPSTSTRTRLFPVHRYRLFIGRAQSGMLPTLTGDPRVSRRAIVASADRLRTVGAFWTDPRTRRPTSDAPVAILSSIPVRAFSRCTWDRFGEARQDRFYPAAVTRRSFSRSRAPSFDGRCAALLPLSRAAIAHPVPRGFALRELLLGSRIILADNPGRPCVVLRTPPAGNRFFRRLRLPPPRVLAASQWRASFDKRGPPGTADSTWNDSLHP